MDTKPCTKCGVDKPLEDFPRTKATNSGRVARCTLCTKSYQRAYRAKNKQDINARRADAYKRDPERRKRAQARASKHALANREKRLEYNRDHYAKNKSKYQAYAKENAERIKERRREHSVSNRDRINARHRRWVEENYESHKERRRQRHAIKWKTDPNYKARILMREYLRRALGVTGGVKTSATVKLMRYRPEHLRQRMEAQFKPGMSWENHGEWHIDHKIPIAVFFAKGETRPHVINALSNLQPLWAEENLRKNANWAG